MALPYSEHLCTKKTVKKEGLNVWVNGGPSGEQAEIECVSEASC